MNYEVFNLGESTGIIIEADNEDVGWEKFKKMGMFTRSKRVELVEI